MRQTNRITDRDVEFLKTLTPFRRFRSFKTVHAGFTLMELLTGICIVAIPISIGQFVAKIYGVRAGIGAGIVSAAVCVTVLVQSYRASWRRDEQRRKRLTEKYPSIYRVLTVPTGNKSILKAKSAEILVGDYGWEAEPIHEDGLIYLQGLSREWRVVWHAGFQPDQIEKASQKPRSQYYIPYAWRLRGQPITHPCPFPVQKLDPPTMGFPV